MQREITFRSVGKTGDYLNWNHMKGTFLIEKQNNQYYAKFDYNTYP